MHTHEEEQLYMHAATSDFSTTWPWKEDQIEMHAMTSEGEEHINVHAVTTDSACDWSLQQSYVPQDTQLPWDSTAAAVHIQEEQIDMQTSTSSFSTTWPQEDQIEMQAMTSDFLSTRPQEEEQIDAQAVTSDFASTWSLQQSYAPQDTQFGTLECPTAGSQGHYIGTCTPCAFIYTKGCSNGVFCSFCHLCDPAERKRRAKDKRAAKKTTMPWTC
jgi:hypothetical protein